MTTALVAPVARQRVFTPLGIVAPGAKYEFYDAGTSTHATTWSNADLATIHENTWPVVADSAGLFGPIYLAFGVQYDVILKDEDDNVLWSQPNVGNSGIDSASQYNVVDFGAVGNGTTNDAAAFQAALDAIKASGNPGTLYIPNGTYRIIGALTYHDGPPLRVQGQSKPGAVLVWDDTATRGFDIDSTVSAVQTSLTVDGAIGDRTVTVANGALANVGDWAFLDDSQTNGGTLVTKIKSIAGNDLTLEDAVPCPFLIASAANVRLYPAGSMLEGIEFHDVSLTCASTAPTNKLTLLLLSRCDSPLVENCVLDGSTGPIITTRQTYNGNILRNTFLHAVTVAGSGIENQTATGLLVQGNDISMCQFGCTFASSPYCRFEGNRVNGRNTTVALGRGVRYGQSSNFGIVQGNNISDTNLFGVYDQDSAFMSITGNTISFTGSGSDLGEHGIQLGGFETNFCHHNVVSNNVIRGCSGVGISIAPSAAAEVDLYNVVSGNSISKCVQGGILLFRCAWNIVTGNNISAPGATNVGGLIYVQSTGAGRNVIANNVLVNEDTTVVPAITTTNGSLGQNTIFGNQLGAFLAMITSDNDLIGAFGGQIKTDEVATGANTTETTAVSFTVKGNTLQPKRGFYFRGIFSMAANGNNKSVNVYVGTSFSLGTPAAMNAEQLTVEIEAIMVASNSVRWWVNMFKSSGAAEMSATFTTSTDDWTADQVVAMKMLNGTASAADITFRMGKLNYT
jgi:parallel beta-helix repeat protein